MSNHGEGERGKNGGIEESLPPDMLKNTASNIARLEDVIEHSKGRQKYLAQTRSPSDGSDVRWYFCKVPLAYNELAASIPNTEIVGKSEYFRFGMRDSLAIEASFLEREDELLSAWWKEYAECSEGPTERSNTGNSNAQSKVADSEDEVSGSIYPLDEERVGVPVKGGLYEVDLLRRHCFPVYWNGENRRVLRGHWFAQKGGLDWLPLREDVSEQLEFAYRSQVWHRRTFQPSGLFAARVDVQGSTPGLHALFTGEDDTWEAWLNVDPTGFSYVISISGNGIKLRRGYSSSQSPKPTQEELRQQKEEEMDDYCSQVPVRHLVFMVHGIGQRLEKSNLVDDVSNFRHITETLAEQHLTSYQRNAQRVLFIPCQWRKALKLSGEAAVEKITLDGVRGLRTMLSATVHDVLYYMSPIYCQDIIDSVSNQLNRLYLKFLKRNPGYDGKVSLYGHSLGSVLSYDILCHQKSLSSPFPMESIYKQPEVDLNSLQNKDQSSLSSSLENRDVSLQHETMEKTICTYKDREESKPTLLVHKEGTGDSSFDSPLNSESTEFSSKALEPDKPFSMEDIDESSCDLSNMISQGTSLEEMTRISRESCETSEQSLEKVATKPSEDMAIKARDVSLLEKEIDSLRAKVAELELHCCGRDAGNKTKLDQTSCGNMIGQNDVPKSYTPYIRFTKLEFKVDTFFAVGSPLGVFLALRNVRIGIGKGEDYWSDENIMEEMPACRQMFNIFHPFDPVAYRVEPLVCKEYITKRPVIVPYHKGGKRLHIGFQEFAEDLAARSQAIVDRFNLLKVKVLTVCQSRNSESLEEAVGDSEGNQERSYGSLMMEQLTGSEEGRIDHVLQDKTFQHPYISAIGSHTNYWRDYDTALFILRHLYCNIPEEANCSLESYATPNANTGNTDWINRKEPAEEEVPLTFSDRNSVSNFSRRAKKNMKL